MEWRSSLMVVLGVLSCVPAVAAVPGNRFAELSFQKPDEGDQGASFRASVLLGRRMVIEGGLDAREHLGGGAGLASLGVGRTMLQNESTRMVLGLSAEGLGGDFGPDDEAGSLSGAYFGAGLNWEVAHRFSDRVELLGRLKVTTIDDYSRVFGIGARFYMTNRLALVADLLQDDLGTRIGAGIRIDFSRQ